MKKQLLWLFYLTVTLCLTGCGQSSENTARTGNQSAGVNDVLEAEMAAADNKNTDNNSPDSSEEASSEPVTDLTENSSETVTDPAGDSSEANNTEARQSGVNENAPEPEPIEKAAAVSGNTDGIDVDLTALSSTMVYSEVYNMLSSPDDYIGKTVRMKGLFSYYHPENTDTCYYACIIQDATACCAQGLEFVPTDNYSYPEDFPEQGGEICVDGVFDVYTEGDYMYCTLRNAVIV